MIDTPSVNLTPLLDADTGRVRLEMPEDFMRLGSTIEFIHAQTNVIEREKSALYQSAFKAAGFVFPATVMGGNPSTTKPYDEGYFVADATGATFHLRQMRGKPDIRRVSSLASPEDKPKWEALKPLYFHVQEQDNREVHTIIVDKTNQAWFVVGKNYHLVPIPLKNYNPARMSLVVRGDLINRLVTATGDDYVEAVVLDRDYGLVDRYSEPLVARASTPAGKLARAIFPFTLRFEDVSSGYLGVFPEFGSSIALAVNGALLAALLAWLANRKQLSLSRLPEILAVAIGGLYGVILAILMPKPD